MAVYGHEIKRIDFSKGLWLADTPDNIPDGYCSELTNMEIDATGAAVIRQNFVMATVQGPTNVLDSDITKTAITSPPPEHFADIYTKAFSFAPVGADDPLILMQVQTTSPNGTISWCKKNGSTLGSTTKAVTTFARDMTQYRDRYYALNIAGTDVSRWSFPGGSTLTQTSVGTIPACHTLITFRDRLFAFSDTRVYYTELATAGAAENWNSGNNFFDMPSLGAKIVNAIPHNDRIFIFTTEGAYQVYCLGSPSTWNVSLITSTVRVYSKNSVALIRDVFIYTDSRDIYTFNGNYPQSIGQPIMEDLKESTVNSTFTVINGPTGFRILPYAEGFILALTFAINSASFWTESEYPRYYYFNGSTWSKIEFGGANASIHRAIINTFKTKPITVFSNEPVRPTDVIIELRQDQLSPVRYDVRMLSVRASNTYAETTSDFFRVAMSTKRLNMANEVPYYTRLFSVMASVKARGNLYWDFIVPDNTGADIEVSDGLALSATDLETSVVRLGVDTIERTESLQITLFFLFAGDASHQNYPFPTYRINNLSLEVNTDTRLMPEKVIQK